jgi:phosphopantothenoylcysteine decarboxylase/phosphopantothenate--cysteine ligase
MEKDNKTNLLIGITGGIASYKILEVISKLKKLDSSFNITVVMTKNATKFVTPITFSTLTGNKTYTTGWDNDEFIAHINLSDKADIFLIAPATYNIIGKIANGIADDLLTSIASAIHCRKIIAPAMNVNMYLNPILRDNLKKLQSYDWEIIPPDEGLLACNYIGKGKLATPDAIIQHITYKRKNELKLKGKKVLITAGGTIEKIDPVRYITNKSSGKMGINLSKVASQMGAEVTLIVGNVSVQLPENTKNIKVSSAIEMKDAVLSNYSSSDIIIMAAAVADYRVKNESSEKIKKNDEKLMLELVRNPDILLELSKLERKNKIVIGFAAETNDLEANAIEKLNLKKLDFIVANDVSSDKSGFESDDNKVTIYFKDGKKEDLPLMPKEEVSRFILNKIADLMS